MALRDRIMTLAVPAYPALPAPVIAWPASVFTPDIDQPFIGVGEAITPPQRMLVGNGSHERTGTLALSYVAALGHPVEVYRQAAGAIAGHFQAGLKMCYNGLTVHVTAAPQVQEGYRDNGWWRVPVIVSWRCGA